MLRMADTSPLPMLVLLPGLDGTGKLFANFVRALGAGVECRIVGHSSDEPLGYEELEQRVRAAASPVSAVYPVPPTVSASMRRVG